MLVRPEPSYKRLVRAVLCVLLSGCVVSEIGPGALALEDQTAPPAERPDPPVVEDPPPMATTCGDGACNGTEDCETCEVDCGACAPTCGDAQCGASEDCTSCPSDCGQCPSVCGDTICETDETCASCEADCGSCEVPPEWEALEQGVLQLLNEQRLVGANCGGRAYGASAPLVMNPALRTAARDHSMDMAERNYFDHTSLDGRSPWQRMSDAGYGGVPIGENIAAGNDSSEATFQQWLTSPGHCQNMMNPDAKEIGIGYGYVQGSRFRHYWTQTFGR